MAKRKTAKPKYKYVEVTWIDAISDSSWLQEADFPLPAIITTRGWLVREEKDFITLAGTLGQEGDFGEVITIPRCWANAIKELKVSSGKRA